MHKLFSIFSLVLLFFAIVLGQANLDIPLTASDGINSNNWLAIGVDTAATAGIDPALGESDLPPFPPAGTFEARFDLTPYAGEPLSSYKDYRNAPSLPFLGVVEHRIKWQLTTGATAFQISYNLPPEVILNIKDLAGGIIFNSGILSGTGTYSIPPAYIGLDAALVTMSVIERTQLTVNISNGWNLVSVPGLHPENQNVITWWPGQDPVGRVYKFSYGYQQVTVATSTEGYWMKHLGAQTYNTGDEWPTIGIFVVPNIPITGAAGWNLIGGYELSVSTLSLTTNPPGLLSGPVYAYSGGYQVANNLDPGYGYWLKLTAAGQIIIPETLTKETEFVNYFPEDWGKIILTDAEGKSYTLYAVKGEVDLTQYELPPPPPEGMFDIRYGSGRIAEDLNKGIQSIEMSGIKYPIRVKVENIKIKLQDEASNVIDLDIEPDEEITIDNLHNNKLFVVAGEFITPIEYVLEQNYPNPFNPVTTVKFSIPEAANVTLTIYNVLGEKVTTLVDSKLEAGWYNYQWNANNAATGIYIYELRTEKFVSVKKMILMK